MSPRLAASWGRAWRGLQARTEGLTLRDALLAAYAEAHRRYHTLQHLQECLDLFEQVHTAADRPAVVEMALWFHDAIYALQGSENEARSAAWAQEALLQAGVAPDDAHAVAGLVLVTRHTEVPQTRDAQVLVDIDLAILGAEAPRFAEYGHQIREEYAHVPESLFRLKRAEILQAFLDRAEIFHTPVLRQRLEARARANLAGSVMALCAARD